jgi:hypothetical protein
MALAIPVYDGIRVCACRVRNSNPKNEVNQHLKFLRLYKMTEKTACQKKKHNQEIFGKGRKNY